MHFAPELRRAEPDAGQAPHDPALRISVVVPTCRRPELLQRCLQALLSQTFPPEAYEIIVVDDARSERTRRQVKALAREADGMPRLLYLRADGGRGPAVARNCGWRAARAPLIAFTDDDTIPAPDWLLRGEQALRGSHTVALAGRIVVPRAAGTRPTDHELTTRGLERAEFVTANAFVRRHALLRVGGFDERFTRARREDADLQYRLEQRFGAIARCDAVVLHPVRRERWGVSLRRQRNVFFDALLYREHPRRYRRRVRPVPPWNDYAIVGLSLAALMLAAAGAATAAAICGALALALVLQLAARRLRHSALTPSHVLEMLLTSAAIPFLSVYWRLRGALHFRVWFW